MIKRHVSVFILGTILLVLTGSPLFAGGWVVVTLDELPRHVQAGTPITVGFTIRQHGRTLINLDDPSPQIEATNSHTGESIEVTVKADGFIGHYSALVTFPNAGLWEWQINPRPFPTVANMPPLTVRGIVPLDNNTVATANPLLQWVVLVQQWFQQAGLSPLAATARSEQDSLVMYGRDLFVAKGCASCHVHEAARVEWNAQIGPDLTIYDRTALYLQLWLADPIAVKPTTAMPNLELDPIEIDALTAFLMTTNE